VQIVRRRSVIISATGYENKQDIDVVNKQGVALGPISLSFGTEFGEDRAQKPQISEEPLHEGNSESIHSMTTDQWRQLYEKEGSVDLWIEEEFNAGSRLMVRVR
jgi:ferredoxin